MTHQPTDATEPTGATEPADGTERSGRTEVTDNPPAVPADRDPAGARSTEGATGGWDAVAGDADDLDIDDLRALQRLAAEPGFDDIDRHLRATPVAPSDPDDPDALDDWGDSPADLAATGDRLTAAQLRGQHAIVSEDLDRWATDPSFDAAAVIFGDTVDSDDSLTEDPAAFTTTESGVGQVRLGDGGVDLPLAMAGTDSADPHPRDGGPDGDGEPETPEPTAAELRALAEVERALDTRWGETQIAPTLTRVAKLMDLLGHPEDSFRSIHVAGTNGKTSTVRMIEALLRAFQCRTGRTTSPHLQRVTERIAIDGRPISPATYVRLWEDIAPYVEMVDAASTADGGPRMSKFEVLSALAYAAFADAPVDVAAVEVGMGGTWDATNVIDSDVAVIMPIGMDHTDYLGDTLEMIAAEKAGIIKPRPTHEDNYTESKDNVVIVGAQQPEAMRVIMDRAAACESAVARFGTEFSVESARVAVGGQQVSIRGLGGVYDDIFLPLAGDHQAHNAACALAAVEAFFGAAPGRQLDVDTVRRGFASVTSPGRLERVRTNPSVFVDAAHNPHGAAALGEALERDFAFTRLVGVLAILQDKDARGILTALEPYLGEVVCSTNSSPRAMPADELADLAREIFGDDRVHTEPDLRVAVEVATDVAVAYNEDSNPGADPAAGAGVIVTGSVVTAGAVRTFLGLTPS